MNGCTDDGRVDGEIYG